MGPPLRFGLLFPKPKEVGVDFPLRLRFRLSGHYEFLGWNFAKLMCLWLMMWLRVVSLSNGHLDARCERARHKQQRSTILAEDAKVV